MSYRIPLSNLPRLQEEIAKLNKRAARLNLKPVQLIMEGTETVTRKDEFLGVEYHDTFQVCRVEGEAPKLAGWRLIASVKPAGDELLVREVPGESCPSIYRKTNLHCDHCNSNRRRSAIFVLQQEDTQEYRQVGSTCIGDFLGTASPESILSAAEYLFDFVRLAGEAQEEGWGGSGRRVVPIDYFVSVVSVIHRRLGYVSRTVAREQMTQATADCAWEICTSSSHSTHQFIRENDLFPTADDMRIAQEALAWGRIISPDNAVSNYLHNLGVCCRQSVVSWDEAGFVASVIQAYNRQFEQEAMQAKSVHLGTIGKREEFNLKIVGLSSSEGDWGPVTHAKFMDESGNVLSWWASGSPDWLHVGDTVKVKATVKRHTEYHGVKQTELKLVKPME